MCYGGTHYLHQGQRLSADAAATAGLTQGTACYTYRANSGNCSVSQSSSLEARSVVVLEQAETMAEAANAVENARRTGTGNADFNYRQLNLYCRP